jgi:hypothetical protein
MESSTVVLRSQRKIVVIRDDARIKSLRHEKHKATMTTVLRVAQSVAELPISMTQGIARTTLIARHHHVNHVRAETMMMIMKYMTAHSHGGAHLQLMRTEDIAQVVIAHHVLVLKTTTLIIAKIGHHDVAIPGAILETIGIDMLRGGETIRMGTEQGVVRSQVVPRTGRRRLVLRL